VDNFTFFDLKGRTMAWLEDSDLPACRAWVELEILSARAMSVSVLELSGRQIVI